MTDDGPNYSRNIVRRRQLVPVVGAVFFTTTMFFFLLGMKDDTTATDGGPVVVLRWYAFEVVRVPVADDTFPDRMSAVGGYRLGLGLAFALVSSLVGFGGGFAADRIHRSWWPEVPDAG